MTWTCMPFNGTGSLVFIHDGTVDRSSKLNSELYWSILSAHIEPNETSRAALHKVDGSWP